MTIRGENLTTDLTALRKIKIYKLFVSLKFNDPWRQSVKYQGPDSQSS